jgi:hypothetical protein
MCMRVSSGSGSCARNASMRALALSAVKGSVIRLMQAIRDPAKTTVHVGPMTVSSGLCRTNDRSSAHGAAWPDPSSH